MAEIYIGPKLALVDFPQEFLREIKNICTIPNPDYAIFERVKRVQPKMRRMPNPHPRKILTWDYKAGTMFVPRGLLECVRMEASKRNISYTLTPLIVEPKPSTPFQADPSYVLDAGQLNAVNLAAARQGGVIEGKTGSGKTLTSFKLVEVLQLRTLFLVNTDVLTTQTMEEAEKVFGVKPGLIKGQTTDIQDFTVGSIQTLVRRDLKEISKEFGILIQDECHLASADTFQTVLGSFYAARIYGLSGTPKDGRLPPLMFQAIGPHLTTLSSVRVVPVKVYQIPTPYTPSRVFDPFEKTEHITELSMDSQRNSFIVSHLNSNLRSSAKSLILTERVDHAELLYQKLTSTNPRLQIVLYHGQLKPDSRRKAILQTIKHQTPQVTIATYKAIGTGTDVPPWEDIYLASPLTSPATIKQAIGRARRIHGNKVHCSVYDYVDPNDPTLVDKARRRLDVYEDL